VRLTQNDKCSQDDAWSQDLTARKWGVPKQQFLYIVDGLEEECMGILPNHWHQRKHDVQ